MQPFGLDWKWVSTMTSLTDDLEGPGAVRSIVLNPSSNLQGAIFAKKRPSPLGAIFAKKQRGPLCAIFAKKRRGPLGAVFAKKRELCT